MGVGVDRALGVTPSKNDLPTVTVVIISAGITGLPIAYRLHQFAQQNNLPLQIKLLETLSEVDGVLRTEYRDGFVLKRYLNAFVTTKPWAYNGVKT